MTPRKFHVYTADLNPRFGTEPGQQTTILLVLPGFFRVFTGYLLH
jgi:hypothetical protein